MPHKTAELIPAIIDTIYETYAPDLSQDQYGFGIEAARYKVKWGMVESQTKRSSLY